MVKTKFSKNLKIWSKIKKKIREAAEKYKNWGKWGPDDEIGTLNNVTAEDIIKAVQLVKKGKVISLALNFDHHGPQGAKSKYPAMGRTNPIHSMLRTGTDAYSGVLDKRGIRAADDTVFLPTSDVGEYCPLVKP